MRNIWKTSEQEFHRRVSNHIFIKDLRMRMKFGEFNGFQNKWQFPHILLTIVLKNWNKNK